MWWLREVEFGLLEDLDPEEWGTGGTNLYENQDPPAQQ